MANILPTDVQKKVWRMYRSRLVLVTGIALIGLAAASALTLIPGYVALEVAAPQQASSKPAESDTSDAVALERSQALIRELHGSFAAATSSMAITEDALALRPAGIRVTRISYQSGEKGKIMLSGEGTRETITGYRDALMRSGIFDSVSIPVGGLVPAAGGPFTIVVSGDF